MCDAILSGSATKETQASPTWADMKGKTGHAYMPNAPMSSGWPKLLTDHSLILALAHSHAKRRCRAREFLPQLAVHLATLMSCVDTQWYCMGATSSWIGLMLTMACLSVAGVVQGACICNLPAGSSTGSSPCGQAHRLRVRL